MRGGCASDGVVHNLRASVAIAPHPIIICSVYAISSAIRLDPI